MQLKHSVQSITELRKAHGPVHNVNARHRENLTPLEKLALFITQHVGTMGFFFIIFGWSMFWLGWNMVGPAELRFDPFPGFVLWLFISNLIQLHLMPLIMIGQNIQSHHAEFRAEAEYRTSVKAEKEIETILMHLENQQEVMETILQRLEKQEKFSSSS
jgi:uncharacterized membrane protein